MKKLSIVVALSKNKAIGKDNQLLWHLPTDLKHFKNITSGGTVVMGRKTYDSIGKALPNRKNIVISRQQNLILDDAVVVASLNEALAQTNDNEVFIIGGADIFKLALPLCSTIYLTTVHEEFDADTFFPELIPEEWIESEKEEHQADDKNKFAYTFSTLKRSK